MSSEDPARIALSLQPDVDSIREAAGRMLAALQGSGEPAAGAIEAVQAFSEELTRIALNWMATGETHRVRSLVAALHEICVQSSEELSWTGQLSPGQRLLERLLGLGEMLAVFTRTDNLAKHLGILSGERRRTWARALETMYELDIPVRAGDLCERGVFSLESTASNALNRLTEHGLVARRNEGGRAVLFDLTWTGRAVARVLKENRKDEEDEKDEKKRQEETQASLDVLAPILHFAARGFTNSQIQSEVGLSREGLARAVQGITGMSR